MSFKDLFAINEWMKEAEKCVKFYFTMWILKTSRAAETVVVKEGKNADGWADGLLSKMLGEWVIPL